MASKRPFDRNHKEQNGKRKMQKMAHADKGAVVYKLLCHGSKFGSLVGKGGEIVTKIRQDTGAKIRIEDTVPGCEERIVVITGFDKEGQKGGAWGNADNEENVNAGEGEDGGEGDESIEKKEMPLLTGKGLTSAQRALLLVVERIATGELDSEGGLGPSKDPSVVVARMLIQPSQVGCLLGKAGSVIKQMSAESGALIRILSKDMIPPCASPADELVQITGSLDEVKKALQSVSQRLLENPPRESDALSANKPSGPSNFPFVPFPPPTEILPPINFHHGFPRPPFPPRLNENADFLGPLMPNFPEGVPPGRLLVSPEPVTFRMICINDKIGNVIGKGGSTIKKLKHDTGCEIRVSEAPPGTEDRVIIVTGPAFPDDRVAPPQNAAIRLLEKIATRAPDNKDNVSTRILVAANQTGCLLGKGGNIITEMRRTTGAQIRILTKEQAPKCASENDEAIQISGEYETVQEALFQITSRLKHHHFRDRFPALNHPGRPFTDRGPPFPPPFIPMREPSPPGPFSSFGSSFRNFGGSGGLNEERPFGLPPGRSEKFSSSSPWPTPGIGDGAGPVAMHDLPVPPQRMGGFPGGGQQPVITNTTVDVVVPRSAVPSIYGEDGDSLKQIRQISGANITIKDPEPGTTETVIIISGAPDQTHAAQSLIQAFVLSETDTS